MDTYREHPSDFDLPASAEADSAEIATTAIGTDERRMHVRAYNYWVSLLDGRDFPSIEDLEPGDVTDFQAHSILLDFTCGHENPAVPYIGAAIRDECDLDDDTGSISEVPSRSLLSRLTDHYMQIIANRAPIGFEAEFANQREEMICYRGILMPFSSDAETIDFIYGVINWKRAIAAQPAADQHEASGEAAASYEPVGSGQDNANSDQPLELTETVGVTAAMVLGPIAEDVLEIGPMTDAPEPAAIHFSWEDGPLADVDAGELPNAELDGNAGLAERLWAARETADAVKAGEGRTRAALYRALSLAYDFALSTQENPQEYAELLEESGMKAQARAQMTPVVKLVFGIDYDKARLTEFAAALSYALREDVALGGFQDLIEKQAGGLKGLVAAERQARRPEPKSDTKGAIARAKLRTAAPISLADVRSEDEFAILLTRRGADGRHEAVAVIDDEALIERAIRRAA